VDVTSILLVEEYPLVRRGTRLLLEADPQLEVCAGVSTLAEAVESAWDPDLVVHALLLPDAAGPEVVTRLRQRFPRARLLALARLDDPIYVHLALTAGDNGYVSLKSAAPGEVLEAVRRVAPARTTSSRPWGRRWPAGSRFPIAMIGTRCRR
jgi:DNA-binding NarL/FixJ family response regulator